MVDGVRVRGFDDAKVIGHSGQMRQQLAHVDPVLPLWRKREHGGRNILVSPLRHGGDPLSITDRFREWFVELFMQVRFIIEQIQLTRRAGHEEENDSLCLGREMSPNSRSQT